jgi:competence protein ComEC
MPVGCNRQKSGGAGRDQDTVNRALFAFVAGAAVACRLAQMPATGGVVIMTLLVLPTVINRRTRWLLAAALGFLWCVAHSNGLLLTRLPYDLEGQDLQLDGTVVSLPRTSAGVTRFRFRLGDCTDCWAPVVINLTEYHRDRVQTSVRPGERWRFTVRLNRPRGSVNPGLFDYEGWLFAEQVSATGYIRPATPSTRLAVAGLTALHHQIRYVIRESLNAAIEDPEIAALAVALAIGDSQGISPAAWRTLSQTGTNHLLIISGLHVGLVAAFAFRLSLWLLSRRLTGLRSWAGLSSLAAAFAYGGLAGFGLPVQRALSMATLALSGTILNRKVTAARLFSIALVIVTLVDPLASIRTGFWLSFGAVFYLLYVFAGRVEPGRHWLWRAVRAAMLSQWVVWIGMTPLLLYLVSQVSLVAFVVNLVAIPVVGLLVIPALIVGTPLLLLFEPLGEICIQFGAAVLDQVWRFLSMAAAADWVYYGGGVSLGGVLIALLGSLVILAPRGIMPRWIGMIMVMPLLTSPNALPAGSVELAVLDVGQGLAVVVRTSHGVVLYDTGPQAGDRFDAGDQIVTPFLRRNGTTRWLDWLIVSHGDHAGGAAAVRRNFLVGREYSEAGDIDGHGCQSGQWIRNVDVGLRLLSTPGTGFSDNDRSCILLIETEGFVALLPGDIEAVGESNLLSMSLPEIDVMLVPHHGSKSSSSPAFINGINPSVAIFSTGYRNRFGHPDAAVVRRYQLRGVSTWNTAADGAITVRYDRSLGITVVTERTSHRRFWYD